jgi:pantetheine-phosphate adenylyltransferase|tara:strand:+ start:344 stop:808 length:465 start_codon:yes stop_codon:yes gene_type:complete
MKSYDIVALGGTFDIIHNGHIELLNKAFSISHKTIIGLTSDELAIRKGKDLVKNYEHRLASLKSVIEKNFPKSSYEVSKLENDFGPAVIEGNVQALVVSKETRNKGLLLNELRAKRNLPSVEIVVIPMVLAEDGNPISTTRIKNSEIDNKGNLN